MVETFVPLSATHHGDVADAVRPQALTRFGSLGGAAPARFDTSGCTAYVLSTAATAGADGSAISRTITTGSDKDRSQPSFMYRLHFSLCSSVTGGNGSRPFMTTKRLRRPRCAEAPRRASFSDARVPRARLSTGPHRHAIPRLDGPGPGGRPAEVRGPRQANPEADSRSSRLRCRC